VRFLSMVRSLGKRLYAIVVFPTVLCDRFRLATVIAGLVLLAGIQAGISFARAANLLEQGEPNHRHGEESPAGERGGYEREGRPITDERLAGTIWQEQMTDGRAAAATQLLVFARRTLVLTTCLFALGLAVRVRHCTIQAALEAVAAATIVTTLLAALLLLGSWYARMPLEVPSLGSMAGPWPAARPWISRLTLADVWAGLVLGASVSRAWDRPRGFMTAATLSLVAAWALLTRGPY